MGLIANLFSMKRSILIGAGSEGSKFNDRSSSEQISSISFNSKYGRSLNGPPFCLNVFMVSFFADPDACRETSLNLVGLHPCRLTSETRIRKLGPCWRDVSFLLREDGYHAASTRRPSCRAP